MFYGESVWSDGFSIRYQCSTFKGNIVLNDRTFSLKEGRLFLCRRAAGSLSITQRNVPFDSNRDHQAAIRRLTEEDPAVKDFFRADQPPVKPGP